MVDFVSYVAKAPPPEDEKAEGAGETGTNKYSDGGGRRCYVFFCSGGCSRDFISSIGEAFKLGYKVSAIFTGTINFQVLLHLILSNDWVI